MTWRNQRMRPATHAADSPGATGERHGRARQTFVLEDAVRHRRNVGRSRRQHLPVPGLGAIVLGAGLALLVPDILGGYAIPLLVAGILVHGTGMSLKHRLDGAARVPLWWEKALFWSCWIVLALLAAWLLARLLAA